MVPSILGMTGALAGQGGAVTIVTPTPSRREWLTLPPNVVLEGPVDDLEGWVRGAEVVHLHGLWQGHTRRGARAARRSGVPHMIAAHGMAEPWALRQKALEEAGLHGVRRGQEPPPRVLPARALPSGNRPPARLAPRTPIALIPNGVDLRPFENLPPRSELEAEYSELAGKFVLLFFSRLHVKKGLDLLAAALGALAPSRSDLHVLVAGNDDGARNPFETKLAELGVLDRVTFVGHVAGARARQVWGAADAFILPSYSEGFSMAILEALAAAGPRSSPRRATSPNWPPPRGESSSRRPRRPSLRGSGIFWNALLPNAPPSPSAAGSLSNGITPGTARPSVSPPSIAGSRAGEHRRKQFRSSKQKADNRGHINARIGNPGDRGSGKTNDREGQCDRPRQERGRESAPVSARPLLGR